MPPKMLSTVDLPAPLAPKMMVYFPSGMVKLMSSTARMVVLPMVYSRTTCSNWTPAIRAHSIFAIVNLTKFFRFSLFFLLY